MADVRFTVNELHARRPERAVVFEQEIRAAVAPGVMSRPLTCRILIEDADPDRVRIQFERPGWVLAIPPLPLEAPPALIRTAASEALGTSTHAHWRV